MGYDEANKTAPYMLKETYEKYLLAYEYFDHRNRSGRDSALTVKAPPQSPPELVGMRIFRFL